MPSTCNIGEKILNPRSTVACGTHRKGSLKTTLERLIQSHLSWVVTRFCSLDFISLSMNLKPLRLILYGSVRCKKLYKNSIWHFSFRRNLRPVYAGFVADGQNGWKS